MDKKRLVSKCAACGKASGILPFECRCKKFYCVKHRIPESHGCIFDYKSDGKRTLIETLTKISKNKIENI
jgi:predicted nucleic acid binding AN1-type Zn finger protein